MKKLVLLICMSLLAAKAQADTPSVATDIAPVHSLTAQVMRGLGSPDLIVRAGASPHGYAMHPSEAAALQRADLIIWMGEGLTPWLGRSITALAAKAPVIGLLEAPGTQTLNAREALIFETDDHEHEEDGHDVDHDNKGVDPHAWLDPRNAVLWLGVIAAELSELDPENAATYRANAAAAQAELETLMWEVGNRLKPFRGQSYLVFHDAYQYFERRFEIPAAGALTHSDANDPGPARVSALRKEAEEQRIACVFTEPQFDPKLVRVVFGDGVRRGVLDPLGSTLEPGPELYPELIRGMAEAMVACLKP